MTDDKKFRGIIVPILTPLTPDEMFEKVDKNSLRGKVRMGASRSILVALHC